MTQTPPPLAQPIRAVIFDLGGVILRTEDGTPRNTLAKKLGISRAELEQIVFGNPISLKGEEGQASLSEVWENIGQMLKLPPEEVQAFEQAFFSGDQVDYDLVDLIRSMRPHYRTALLSNSWQTNMPRFLQERLQIPADTFDVILSSATQKMVKPSPPIFMRTLELLQVEPAEAVFVDDNAANIAGARAIGLHTIHFRSAQQARQELRAYLPFLSDPGAAQ